jgi:carboxylesterase
MGGTTALLLAARQPVAGVVSMSAPIQMPRDPRLPFARAIGVVQPFIEKEQWDESQRASRYAVFPTLAVRAFAEYVEVVEHALLAVTAPALLLHSRSDERVPPSNMEHIYARLGSLHKEMLWLDEAGHVLTEDPTCQQEVFARVAAFVATCTAADKPGMGES